MSNVQTGGVGMSKDGRVMVLCDINESYFRVYNEAYHLSGQLVLNLRHQGNIGDSNQSCSVSHQVVGNLNRKYNIMSFLNLNVGETVDVTADFAIPSWTFSSWTRTFAASYTFEDCACTENGFLVYVSHGGGIHRSTDFGQTWSGVLVGPYRFVCSRDGYKLFGAAFGNPLYISEDYGSSWTMHESSRQWSGVAGSANCRILSACVYNGYIYTSIDGGVTWIERLSSGNHTWRSIAMPGDGQVIIAGYENGPLSRSLDYGATWTTFGPSRVWYDLKVSDDYQTILGATITGVELSRDSGASWTTVVGGVFLSVAMTPDAHIMSIGGSSGYVQTSVNHGQTWTSHTSIGSQNWRGNALSVNGHYLIVASYLGGAIGGVYVSQINPNDTSNQLLVESGSSITICQM